VVQKVECRNCGEPVDPRRVELGYDYCLKEECQRRYMKRVLVAAVGVNKAADYYTKAEEVLPPPGPASTGPSPEDPEDHREGPRALRRAPRSRVKAKPTTSTLAKLRAKEAELDAALETSYQRFCAGEITAREMDRERDALIRAFNQVVKSENIRYRGMLRRRV
jgi:hypothetical protein